MPEYLETVVDKFTFRVATDRLYHPEGIWVRPVPGGALPRIRIGVTDFLQQHGGDVAFVSVKAVGTRLIEGEEIASLETVKVNLSLPAPVAGAVVEVNAALEPTPEIVNQDPYGEGWLAVIDATAWETDRARLLDPQAYFSVMRAQVEQELKQS
jgi:glycine cleavage system H protein